jgi:FixJ family two-component response regulator
LVSNNPAKFVGPEHPLHPAHSKICFFPEFNYWCLIMAVCGGTTSIVYVVSDQEALSAELQTFLPLAHYRVHHLQSLPQLFHQPPPDSPSCLLVQFDLPDLDPAGLANELARHRLPLPFIFVMSRADLAATVEAMKAGAFTVLAPPLDAGQSRREIDSALARSEDSLYRVNELDALRQRFGSLTSREAGLVPLVASGKPNKQIAAHFGIEQSTVKVHRSRVMRKMGAQSAAQLALMAARLNLLPASSGKRPPSQPEQ